MKYLFFLLLLCNIVFYLWETGAGRTASGTGQAETPLPQDLESIVLFSELPTPPAQLSEPPTVALEAAESQQAPPSPSTPPGQAESSAPVATAETPMVDSAKPAEESPAQPKPEEPLPPAVDKAETCRLLGPYDSQRQAQADLHGLETGQRRLKLVKKPTPVETGYLLIYPAADTPEAAQANRKMIAEKGFKDAWVVDKGEYRNAISLAAFHNKTRADEALGQYRAQGLPVELKPRLGMAAKWWLEVRETMAPAGKPDEDPALAGSTACD